MVNDGGFDTLVVKLIKASSLCICVCVCVYPGTWLYYGERRLLGVNMCQRWCTGLCGVGDGLRPPVVVHVEQN